MIFKIKIFGAFANITLLIESVLFVLLGMFCGPGFAAESTLSMINAATKQPRMISGQSDDTNYEQPKTSLSTIKFRIQAPKEPRIASAPKGAPVLQHTPPSASTNQAQPLLRKPIPKQSGPTAVIAKLINQKQAVENSVPSIKPIAQPTQVIGSECQEEEVSEDITLNEYYLCPYDPTQSGAEVICGIDCGKSGAPSSAGWRDMHPIPWSIFGPGEYIGPPRTEHTFQYYLRVNDQLQIVYILTRETTSQLYRFGVGDELRIESVTDEKLDRIVTIQPDGFIALPQISDVQAAGKTVIELREVLQKLYTKVQRNPQITVTPITFNVALQDIVNSVDRRSGSGGQSQPVRITPEGTIQLPGLGSIFVQGLTLDELKHELEARYRARYGPGLNITPLLVERAPTFVFIGGEVAKPGRYTLEGPTTVMQAIALAGGWNVGGNTNQVVVFRRDENWCLKATKLDLFRSLYGKDPCPINDIWLRDNDLVIVPKRPILVADDIIELYFTRGAYSVFPVSFIYNFSRGSVLP